jgi:hypothetical protein
MNLLITGSGRSGSWQIRGEQLGAALGATVGVNSRDVAAFDLAVVVKRPPIELVERLRGAHVPIVWDVVDAWPQPDGNGWTRAQAIAWLAERLNWVRPHAVVAATQAMAEDIRHLSGLPVLALPHHARPGLVPTDIRPLRIVGYEGSWRHLGNWQPWLEHACAEQRLTFVLNPPVGYEVDVWVALRELTGYPARSWKSNVKLANAQATGTPIICARESGYHETQSGAEIWADTPDEVRRGLAALRSIQHRRELSRVMLAAAPLLPAIAAQYGKWLRSLL